MESDLLENASARGSVRYKEAPDRQSASRHRGIIDLWSGEWNEHRHDEMRKFVPMALRRTEAVAHTRWRIRLADVAQQRLDKLPALLKAADPALQYAAAWRLAETGDHISILLEWFLKCRRRYALRVISSIHEPRLWTHSLRRSRSSRGIDFGTMHSAVSLPGP